MTPAPRRKPAVDGPGPVKLAEDSVMREAWSVEREEDSTPHVPTPRAPRPTNAIDPPEDPRPEPKLGRTLPPGIEPMLGIDDLAALLSCSRRLVERMRSAGKVPRPDIKIGKMPRWRAETIRRWIDGGGR